MVKTAFPTEAELVNTQSKKEFCRLKQPAHIRAFALLYYKLCSTRENQKVDLSDQFNFNWS